MSTDTAGDNLPTPALFEASPNTYTRLLQGATRSTPAPDEKHVQAAPPQMEPYITLDGREIETPVQLSWRDD